MNLLDVQTYLRELKLGGWLFFDHHHRDPLAYRVLGLAPDLHVTRRWYYFVPATGEPLKLVHRIESRVLDSLEGIKLVYSSWAEQTSQLDGMLRNAGKIAMQYSPQCAIPYVAMVDAGTVELVRGTGAEVVSSAELIQFFEARLDEDSLTSHVCAARIVDQVRRDAFHFIADAHQGERTIDEFAVAEFIRSQFSNAGLITDSGPIVAANDHAGDPHYEPSAGNSSLIRRGDFVLLDMWAKLKTPNAIYYDITWAGYCGDQIPEEYQKIFALVRQARDAAAECVRSAFASGLPLHGFEVDDAARDVIRQGGFSDRFVHRTGHSIGVEVHGNGANMDNLETHDDRRVTPWSCFSIEPGIYFDHFGVRSEIDIFLEDRTPKVAGEIQEELVRII